MYNYVVFIMTHGRAGNVHTEKALRECGYTGKIIMVVDTDDEQGQKYVDLYGKERVIFFDKKEHENKMDTGDASGSMKCVVFARNACFDIAKQLGYEYFIEADDDYVAFSYRFEDDKLREKRCHNLDKVFDAMFQFLEDSNAIAVAPAQCGDYIGGKGGGIWKNKLSRKCMNLFFCKTSKHINFIGRINEDVTSYTYYTQQGVLFFTVADWCLHQKATQAQAGGMTDTYLGGGTYLKSFYSVMWSPSCVKIGAMGDKHKRIHHSITWDKCAPKIISEKYKKGEVSGQTEQV